MTTRDDLLKLDVGAIIDGVKYRCYIRGVKNHFASIIPYMIENNGRRVYMPSFECSWYTVEHCVNTRTCIYF